MSIQFKNLSLILLTIYTPIRYLSRRDPEQKSDHMTDHMTVGGWCRVKKLWPRPCV